MKKRLKQKERFLIMEETFEGIYPSTVLFLDTLISHGEMQSFTDENINEVHNRAVLKHTKFLHKTHFKSGIRYRKDIPDRLSLMQRYSYETFERFLNMEHYYTLVKKSCDREKALIDTLNEIEFYHTYPMLKRKLLKCIDNTKVKELEEDVDL